jgi:hypothetical protein
MPERLFVTSDDLRAWKDLYLPHVSEYFTVCRKI